jgi:hypothetical protein
MRSTRRRGLGAWLGGLRASRSETWAVARRCEGGDRADEEEKVTAGHLQVREHALPGPSVNLCPATSVEVEVGEERSLSSRPVSGLVDLRDVWRRGTRVLASEGQGPDEDSDGDSEDSNMAHERA